MVKKLKRFIVLLIFGSVAVIFLLERETRSPVHKFKVKLKSRSPVYNYASLNLMNIHDIKRKLGKKIIAQSIIRNVKESRSKRAIFIYPESAIKIKVVIFTSPRENHVLFKKLKNMIGTEVTIMGRLIEHQKYGLEIIVETERERDILLKGKGL